MKYLLSTGKTTDKVELYILDLFNLYLSIFPGDIPGRKDIGFDFILTDTNKDEIIEDVQYRINNLIDKIQSKFSDKYEIKLNSLDLLNETTVKVVIEVNKELSDDILIDLQKN